MSSSSATATCWQSAPTPSRRTSTGSSRRAARAGWAGCASRWPPTRRVRFARLTASTFPRQHLALRGLFIIDPNGVLQYQVVHNLSVGRRSDEVLRVLDGLQTGGLCPEGWQRDSATLDPAAALGPGNVVGQYRIDARLGAGSFGTVYRARDLTLDRTVALKVVHSSNQAVAASLLNEARAAAALNHPNVCTLFSVDAGDGISMIVMEHLEGRPLAKILEQSALTQPSAPPQSPARWPPAWPPRTATASCMATSNRPM